MKCSVITLLALNVQIVMVARRYKYQQGSVDPVGQGLVGVAHL